MKTTSTKNKKQGNKVTNPVNLQIYNFVDDWDKRILMQIHKWRAILNASILTEYAKYAL